MTWPLIPNPRFLLHSLVRDKKLFTLTIIYTVNEFKKMASSKNRKVGKLSYLTTFTPKLLVRRWVPVVFLFLQGCCCYTWRFATTIFSPTQRCNIVATLFRMVTTVFQHCNAVLHEKKSLPIVLCNITLSKDNGDGNKNGKKATGPDWQNNKFARRCTTTTLKCLVSRFVDDGMTKQPFSFFFSWTLIQSFRILLQRNLPTFDKSNETE